MFRQRIEPSLIVIITFILLSCYRREFDALRYQISIIRGQLAAAFNGAIYIVAAIGWQEYDQQLYGQTKFIRHRMEFI